jgi:hypothetical protein
MNMKKLVMFCFILFFALISVFTLKAQCSICTATASQLGQKQGNGLNAGIVYLMLTPFAVGGYIGYRWWRSEKASRESEGV